jgi:hypothetical protein
MLALPAERVLFVAGSLYDIPGAGQLGMDVWRHNRIGMPARPGPRPIVRAGRAHPFDGRAAAHPGRVNPTVPMSNASLNPAGIEAHRVDQEWLAQPQAKAFRRGVLSGTSKCSMDAF